MFVYKVNNEILVTQNRLETPSCKEDPENYAVELLYDIDLDIKEVRDDLRYYKILGDPDDKYINREEVLEYFAGDPSRVRISRLVPINPNNLISERDILLESIKYLSELGVFKVDLQKLKDDLTEGLKNVSYKCDLFNLLGASAGEKVLNLYLDYQDLNSSERTFLTEFGKLETRDKKLSYAKDNLLRVGEENLSQFIPEWCSMSVKLFSENELKRASIIEVPEFKDSDRVDGLTAFKNNINYFLREEVFEVFNLGDIWNGSKIKSELARIYKKLGLPKKSKVRDIFEFFDASITRKGYKIISRKS